MPRRISSVRRRSSTFSHRCRHRPVVDALIPVGTAFLVMAVTSLPAWLATRIHTADALRYE
jgi:hypothetical protein